MRLHGNHFGIRGCLIDAPVPGGLRVIRDGAIVVEDGRIAEVGEFGALSAKPRPEPVRWLHSPRSVVMPGLLDLHTHLPQYPLCGRAGGDLLTWLRESVFPIEREFLGKKAAAAAKFFFSELGRYGTTSAVVFSSVYEDATHSAFEAAEAAGVRAWIGQTLMDVDGYAPDRGGKTSGAGVSQSLALFDRWEGASDGLLHFVFSPRFALSCSRDLMVRTALAAHERAALIQTHLAENREEVEQVKKRFPESASYTGLYQAVGLLGPRTLLAHSLHLSDSEIDQIAGSRSAAIHCPAANLFLKSGLFRLEKLLSAGVRVGLGTDVAAGPSLSLWEVMRATLEMQSARSFYEPQVRVPTVAEVFRMATLGGAEILGIDHLVGTIDIGKEADLVVLDPTLLLPAKDPKLLQDLRGEDVLSLAIHRGGHGAIMETLVRGRPIYQAPEPGLF